MDQEPQVFSSNITRSAKPLKNDLTDLLQIVPAQAVLQKKYEKRSTCDFKPKNDKYFESKRKSKLKVRTVRDIRNLFEKDVYSTLPVELEKQQNILLRKIKAGSSREENTKALTKNMFKCDKPISRSAWQMLMTLNPEEYAHSTQFVLCNGKRIRVNGSKGGTCKFMCKYDLGAKQFLKKTKNSLICKPVIKKKGLLKNSLSINFKPGPLTKKIFLDHSYQKYHVGEIELQDLPRPALEIHPTLGRTLDPAIAHFLHNMQQADGTISDKWAEFSVSILATVKNEAVTQIEDESCVTFELNYKCDQKRILMRRDVNTDFNSISGSKTVIVNDQHHNTPKDLVDTAEIQSLLNKIIDSVEISLEQDNMFTGEDDPRDVKPEESNTNGSNIQSKETRLKRKCGELERLDVFIIRLSGNVDKEPITSCPRAYCALGCVCTSLECNYNLKGHCGRIECMFECKCDFSKYKVVDSFERDCSDLLPGLLKLDNEMSSKMAKEEQKFHHTVIVTSENSMLLKSKRRDWKSSRKYADFYSSMCLKNDCKPDRVAALVIPKLHLPNVEPWCMVHNLYKCFCKGKFTDSSVPDVKTDETNALNATQQHTNTEDLTANVVKNSLKSRLSNSSHSSMSDNSYVKEKCDDSDVILLADDPHIVNDYGSRSARVKPFKGRKFTDRYYYNANRKISEMEQHDDTLRKRMEHLINISISKNMEESLSIEKPFSTNKIQTAVSTSPPTPPLPSLPSSDGPTVKPTHASDTANTKINLFTNRLPNKEKLVAWLEASYKLYKQRVLQGIAKVSLDPPRLGKMALYPWEFVLSRYKDRKNLFLITTNAPYRIFMAVDPKNPFFRHCININDIRFADLHKYPATVKNLLTNAKDLKDNFCILCGLSHCWELIGSVTKMCEQQKSITLSDDEEQEDFPEMSSDSFHVDSEDSNTTALSVDLHTKEKEIMPDKKPTEVDRETSDSSRWFVMTIENDFNEIQFYNKGFFVKLENILKAINVARASRKTVRLSSQKCVDNTGPQFGIYAIPNDNEPCVFVGPYEKGESLGIETVKNISDIRKQRRTKGVWITTKKLENFEVIDNPLSFMPPKNVSDTEMLTLADNSANTDKNCFVEISKSKDEVSPEKNIVKGQLQPKILKPIKIGKTNSFYQLAPNGTLKQISQQRYNEQSQMRVSDVTPKVINPSLLKRSDSSYAPLLSNTSSILTCIPKSIKINKKPIAEIAPHVKQAKNFPASTATPNPNDKSSKKERGMFILKPEEINKRLMHTQMSSNLEHLTPHASVANTAVDSEIEMDIENFLATSEECEAPNDETLIISDDETDLHNEREHWRDVWIECKSVEDLGWIHGRKNKQGFVSFEFPGFKYTEFYLEEDAFAKLNQVLSRKIYIPKTIRLEWRIVESEQGLSSKHMLKQEDLGSDFILTKRGIRHKQDLICIYKNNKSVKKEPAGDMERTDPITGERITESLGDVDEIMNIVKLDVESQQLEEEGEVLWNKLKSHSNHSVIGQELREIDDIREKIAARLQKMVSDN